MPWGGIVCSCLWFAAVPVHTLQRTLSRCSYPRVPHPVIDGHQGVPRAMLSCACQAVCWWPEKLYKREIRGRFSWGISRESLEMHHKVHLGLNKPHTFCWRDSQCVQVQIEIQKCWTRCIPRWREDNDSMFEWLVTMTYTTVNGSERVTLQQQ